MGMNVLACKSPCLELCGYIADLCDKAIQYNRLMKVKREQDLVV